MLFKTLWWKTRRVPCLYSKFSSTIEHHQVKPCKTDSFTKRRGCVMLVSNYRYLIFFCNCQKWRKPKGKCHPKILKGYFFSVQHLKNFILVNNCSRQFTWLVVWCGLVKRNLKSHLLRRFSAEPLAVLRRFSR